MAPNNVSPAEVIAASDLVISYPFTSTTFEAVSVRRKGIYYDPTSKFRGTYLDGMPRMVCHGYGELLEEARRLLFEVDDSSYQQYLESFAEEYLDPFLDGKGIARFRDLLSSDDKADVLEMAGARQ